jgi:hypothetical protein
MNQIDTKLFEGWTYSEITLELLIEGYLTIPEYIDKKIQFDKQLLTFYKN